MISQRMLETLKVWYSLFTMIMDAESDPMTDKIDKLLKLRERLKQEAPELENKTTNPV